MKKVARMMRNHKPMIFNWFKAKGRLFSGAVEGLNLKAKLIIRKAVRFQIDQVLASGAISYAWRTARTDV